jgi:hypothetical protein
MILILMNTLSKLKKSNRVRIRNINIVNVNYFEIFIFICILKKLFVYLRINEVFL